MPRGRHRRPSTFAASPSEWLRDTWIVAWHTLTRTPLPGTVNTSTTVAQPALFDADR